MGPLAADTSLISITMLLPGNRTHRPWWQELVEPFFRRERKPLAGPQLNLHFAPERFPYGAPGNPTGRDVAEPNFTSVCLVWRA